MFKREVFCIIISLALILGSCGSDKTDPHFGGCILVSPTGEVPDDPYRESDIVPTDEYKPFTKKLMVYGITLIARDDISDAFMKKVAKTIRTMFPRKGSIDRQKRMVPGKLFLMDGFGEGDPCPEGRRQTTDDR